MVFHVKEDLVFLSTQYNKTKQSLNSQVANAIIVHSTKMLINNGLSLDILLAVSSQFSY